MSPFQVELGFENVTVAPLGRITNSGVFRENPQSKKWQKARSDRKLNLHTAVMLESNPGHNSRMQPISHHHCAKWILFPSECMYKHCMCALLVQCNYLGLEMWEQQRQAFLEGKKKTLVSIWNLAEWHCMTAIKTTYFCWIGLLRASK